MREVMKNPPAEEFVQYILRPLLNKDAAYSFRHFNDINKAHLLMLLRQGIVGEDDARSIFTSIREIEEKGIACISLDPQREDLSSCLEAYIMERCGPDVGGRLHTGRSRNDMGGTVTRMLTRDYYLQACAQLNELRRAMLKIAQEQMQTVFTGYTCAQPAEPVTVGSVFAAYSQALLRDFSRLDALYERLNQCPLGSCAMAGTTFPIDRAMVAGLLGFDRESGSALDGIAARDYLLELFSVLSIYTLNLSRFCQDLYMWGTFEYQYVDIDSSVAMCSSIMPQKKNPVTLEHIKAKSAHLEAAFTSAAGALKNTPYTQVRDSSIESAHCLHDAMHEMEASTRLLIVTLETMHFNIDHMLHTAESNFCTVSELANTIVREGNLSFRQAHSVVGKLVAHLLEHKLRPMDITPELVANISREAIGYTIDLPPATIRTALDPRENAFSRQSTGGPAPEQVAIQLKELEEALAVDMKQNERRIERLKSSRERLDSSVDAVIAGQK